MSPARATLLHSPGRKPWVRALIYIFLSPVGAAQPQSESPNTRAVSAAPKGAHSIFICKYPGFHIGLCPHSTLGYAGVSCLKALFYALSPQAKHNNYTQSPIPILTTHLLRRALQGRHSCLAQGASPGLGIDIHFLSPVGAAQPQSKRPQHSRC